ncbi:MULTISPECIES: hypothetical protein [Limnospira]|uniref:Lipoprotein n=1 Tax=Limnospira fusiformis PMC 851.14 TaxID=2219512 RepID=A0ABU9EQK0_LIMFS|nr:hypothetical protein [Limnospira maxima]QJB24400.1 hypothetical protein HFV01_15260 [Limnospira fusiformis SAG 85.79]
MPLYVLTFLSCAIGCISEPSVPRFNPGVMIPKTGGGYRRYSLLPDFSVGL